MWQAETFDKIVTSYFAAVTTKSFTYKGRTFLPKPLVISPLAQRGLLCPAHCGGCCMKSSLLYLPNELHPYTLEKRVILFDGREVEIYGDWQTDVLDRWCKHRSPVDGRCGIHTKHALSCDFETLKFFITKDPKSSNRMTNMPFPRKWSYTRVDGGKGGLCEALPVTTETLLDAARRCRRLRGWCEHFGVDHLLDSIIEYFETGPHTEPLVLNSHLNSDDHHTLFVK